MAHKKLISICVALAALTIATVAAASSSTTRPEAALHPTTGPNAINPTTCKFVHREVDTKTGPSWTNLRTYVLQEDARHDIKMNCTANRRATLGYTRVLAVGTGQTVTAFCPAGYNVFGGGSRDETTGSYPSTDDGWTVVRDRLSPPQLTAYAVCARVVTS